MPGTGTTAEGGQWGGLLTKTKRQRDRKREREREMGVGGFLPSANGVPAFRPIAAPRPHWRIVH